MDRAVFLNLVRDDQLPKVVKGIEVAISKSFAEEQRRLSPLIIGRVQRISQDEVKRRTRMCLDIFKVLRGDLRWSVDRIADALPRFLQNELDGVDWKPDVRACWTPAEDKR